MWELLKTILPVVISAAAPLISSWLSPSQSASAPSYSPTPAASGTSGAMPSAASVATGAVGAGSSTPVGAASSGLSGGGPLMNLNERGATRPAPGGFRSLGGGSAPGAPGSPFGQLQARSGTTSAI